MAGISERNRRRLTTLHRRTKAPFTVGEAAQIVGLDRVAARRWVAHLASQGLLTPVRPNLYTTVPLEATNPAEWREDPWVVAARTFEPGYIGG